MAELSEHRRRRLRSPERPPEGRPARHRPDDAEGTTTSKMVAKKSSGIRDVRALGSVARAIDVLAPRQPAHPPPGHHRRSEKEKKQKEKGSPREDDIKHSRKRHRKEDKEDEEKEEKAMKYRKGPKERYHEHKVEKKEKTKDKKVCREDDKAQKSDKKDVGKPVPPAIARPIPPPFLTPRDGSDTILGRVYKVKKELRQEEESVGLVTARHIDDETNENGQRLATSSDSSSSQAMAIKQLQIKVHRLEQQLQQAQDAGTSSTSSKACSKSPDPIPKPRPNCKTQPKILLPPATDSALDRQQAEFAPRPKVILFKYRSY